MLNRIQNCSVVVSFYYLFIISLCRAYQIVRVVVRSVATRGISIKGGVCLWRKRVIYIYRAKEIVCQIEEQHGESLLFVVAAELINLQCRDRGEEEEEERERV